MYGKFGQITYYSMKLVEVQFWEVTDPSTVRPNEYCCKLVKNETKLTMVRVDAQ